MDISVKFPTWIISANIKIEPGEEYKEFRIRALTAEDACFQIRCFNQVLQWISISLSE